MLMDELGTLASVYSKCNSCGEGNHNEKMVSEAKYFNPLKDHLRVELRDTEHTTAKYLPCISVQISTLEKDGSRNETRSKHFIIFCWYIHCSNFMLPR